MQTSSAMDLNSSLQALLGTKGWLNPPETQPWERDWLNKYGEKPLGVARPKTSEEVSQVLKLCRCANVPVVPQGGNTGLVGGSVLGEAGGVILSLSRMDAISAPDIASGTIEVQAGVVLAHLHQDLQGTGFMFPMHLGAEGSAQIGGLIATNAGGSHAFRYGLMQDLVLGLEVVLSDGAIWNGLRRVQKDNSGYGALQENIVYLNTPVKAAGYLEYERARVRWFLSLDVTDVPASERAKGMASRFSYQSCRLWRHGSTGSICCLFR